eukprot:COSAG01_NODE_8577_length_2734_cov_1.447818_4_plen_52_part_01
MYHRCFVYGYVTAVDTIMPGLDRYPSMTGWKRDSDTGHKALMTGVTRLSLVT